MSAKIQERLDAYRFFTNLFMTLPDEQFARAALEFGIESESEDEVGDAERAFAAFREARSGQPIEDVLLALSIDRTQLVRGVNEDGIRPPYESLYTSDKSESSCLSLAETYRRAGLAVAGNTRETPEFIGCETGFMAELCQREFAAFEANDPLKVESLHQSQKAFFQAHLGRWGRAYAQAMVSFAKTEFFRGIGFLLDEFFEEESALFEEPQGE